MKSFSSILLATLFAHISIDCSADHVSEACSNLCSDVPRGAGKEALKDLILAYDTVSDDDLDGKKKIGKEINCWDVSKLTNLSPAFEDTNFNDRLDCWDTSSFTSMAWMFHQVSTFDADIGMWDVSRVTSMKFMFSGAKKFNRDIGTWNVSSVKKFNSMFSGATAFNQDIHTWDTSNAVNMWGMFGGATSFNQDIGTWDVSSVKSFSFMFRKAASFNQNLCNWKPFPTKFKYGEYTPTYAMFEDSGCDFNQLYVGHAVCQSCAPTCNELKKIVYKESDKNKEKTQLLTEVVADIQKSCGWKPNKKIARLQDIIDIYTAGDDIYTADDDDTTGGVYEDVDDE